MKPFNSLATRLLLASLMLMPLFALLAGVGLQQAFRQSLAAAEEEKLKTQVYLLLGAMDFDNGQLQLPSTLAEPRFGSVNSGLYGWIFGKDGQSLWRSASTQSTPPLDRISASIKPGKSTFTETTGNQQRQFQLTFDVNWIDDRDRETPLRLLVRQDQTAYLATVGTFTAQLWRWLTALCVILLITLWLITRWGLSPLRRLAKEVKAIEKGQQQQLSPNYPAEIQAVTTNLNHLLESEKQQQQRYRNTLSDLAHSLKTPLAVVQGILPELSAGQIQQQLGEQVSRMNAIVQHQLKRAVQNHRSTLNQSQLNISQMIQRLLLVLGKVYQDKHIHGELLSRNLVTYPADEADMMEMLGNILENAYKYGQQQVQVQLTEQDTGLQITVDDDGPGIPAEQQTRILKRGERADTAAPGQGIGLAVSIDIISGYNGSLSMASNALGGARFEIWLPRP